MGNGEADRVVTIVSGLPRSGTSMMMQMLSIGGIPALVDNQREADEDNPRGYFEFEAVKQVDKDASWLADAEGKVVKMVYRLLYALPGDRTYRVIFMLRDLKEVIASQEVMLERLGKGGDTIEPARLEEIYRRQLVDVKAWLAKQPHFTVLYVQYHDALGSPDQVVRDLDAFLAGRLNTEAMLQVPDSSLYRVKGATGKDVHSATTPKA